MLTAACTPPLPRVAAQLPKMHKLGLSFAFSIGHLTTPNASSARVLGGAASFGGVTESGTEHGSAYPTAPEVAWVVDQLVRRNLSHVVAQYFLHDDDAAASGAVAAAVEYLKHHAPHIVPQTNTFPDSGPSVLYRTRQPIFAAEEYAITGTTGNATAETNSELVYFANNEMIADRYRLDTWPLFNLGDGGDVPDINSDSLVRVQVFSALAYGARGLYYYCWGHGIWNMPHPSQVAGRGTPTPNYADVARANKDAMVWGTRLLGAKRLGTFRTAPQESVASARAVAPRAGLVIEAMSAGLLVGVFVENASSLLLMVVDTRTNSTRGAVPPRRAWVQVANTPATCAASAPAIEVTRVAGGRGGYDELRGPAGSGTRGAAGRIEFDVEGGGGVLLSVVDKGGEGCLLETAEKTRGWFFDESAMALRFSYPETSPKAATFSAFGGPPKAYKAGGLAAGSYSPFMIGGDMHNSGFGFESSSRADAWAAAAFNVASLPGANTSVVADGLGWAARSGMFVVVVDAAGGACDGTMSPLTVGALADRFSCHTNLLGLNLAFPSDGSQPRPNEARAASTAMRNAFYWGFPFALAADTVQDVIALADQAIPLAPLAVHGPLPGAKGAAALHGWAVAMARDVANLTAHAVARGRGGGGGGGGGFTPAVMLDACAVNVSSSAARFQAYASVLYGAQAVWWRRMDECAAVGSPSFDLIAAINRRIASFAGPLFLRTESRLYAPIGPGSYGVAAAWSTDVPPPLANGALPSPSSSSSSGTLKGSPGTFPPFSTSTGALVHVGPFMKNR